jgi:DnaJ-class molecular chaperone
MNKQKCLDILGLDNNSSSNDIKKAYKTIALKTHPDKLIDLTEEEREKKELIFKNASEAYNRLINDDFIGENIFEDFDFGSIFENIEGFEGIGGMFSKTSGMKMFSGMASRLFENRKFESIFKTDVIISYFDLLNERKMDKEISICGIPSKATIDCSNFPKQMITRSFQGLSSTVEINFKLEKDDLFDNLINSDGTVDLIYTIKVSHYQYYKGFSYTLKHLDGNDVNFNVKKLSKKSLKIKKRGLRGGDLIVKIQLINPSNKKINCVNNEDYEKLLNILKILCEE